MATLYLDSNSTIDEEVREFLLHKIKERISQLTPEQEEKFNKIVPYPKKFKNKGLMQVIKLLDRTLIKRVN